MHLNLLPARFRIRLLVRAQLRSWARLWAVCLLVVLFACGIQLWQVHQSREQLGSVTEQSRPVRQTSARIGELDQQLARLVAESEQIENLQSADPSFPLLGMFAQCVEKTGGRIQIMRMTVQAHGRRAPAAKPASGEGHASAGGATGTSIVFVQGIATDDESLSQFVTGLRAFGVFQKVDLKSTSRLAAAVDQGREFQLECGF